MEVIHIDTGRSVICDYCGDDYTDRADSGGMMFGTHATCPKCAEKMKPDIIRFGEEHYIRGRCPEGVSFADWVRSIR